MFDLLLYIISLNSNIEKFINLNTALTAGKYLIWDFTINKLSKSAHKPPRFIFILPRTQLFF